MERRTFLESATGLLGTSALAGCLDALGLQTQSAWRSPPLVKNRPNAVYYPAVTEGMAMYGMKKTDECVFALMYSYPHRLWVITGDRTNKVVVEADDSLHLMASVWDRKTATILPTSVSMEVRKNGETVDSRSPWPMLSPTMGFHYGDNVSLDGEGNYTARVSAKPMQSKRFGALDGVLTETQTVDIPFEFDTNEVYGLPIRRFKEKAGTIGAPALQDMNMEMPRGVAPSKSDLPGRVVGEATHGKGHAEYVVTVLEDAVGANGPYLAVSARTPFNHIILPLMSVSATLTRNGTKLFDGPLRSAVGPKTKFHYGTAVDSVESGDVLEISIQAPPQTARHDGYETAFIDMPDVRVTL
ncbi:MAG TPA: iron transporter [Halococcus sp.]|nr:iron transporter [Halococcus sp.]